MRGPFAHGRQPIRAIRNLASTAIRIRRPRTSHSGILGLNGATVRNLPLVLTLAALALLAQSTPTYRVTHTYALGGDESWDYVVPDPPNHRLFIARQNRIMVVDEDSGETAR